jgi:hypothetical protein
MPGLGIGTDCCGAYNGRADRTGEYLLDCGVGRK